MSRHAARVVRRAPVLAVVVAALVAGGLADRASATHPNPAVAAESVQPVPVVAPAAAYSSSWFCGGATQSAPNYSAGQIVVANAGASPVSGTVTVVATAGSPSPQVAEVTVAAHSTTSVPETVPGGSGWTGAIVDLNGGSVAVSQVVDGALGRSASPCATSGSPHWYLPVGQTRVNASETILLLNPYPTDSIVDLSFSTDQGLEYPQDFQGLDVRPGGLVAVPLGTHLRRRASIATTVSARTGNVVAWSAEVVTPPAKGAVVVGTPAANSALADPASPVPGVTVTLGAPSAGTTWVWPDGLAGGGVDERYVIFNPNAQTADVRLSVGLQEGSAEPFQLTVGPGEAVPIVSEQGTRIPPGAAHTATLVSTNGVTVVAARVVAASGAAVAGQVRTGLGEMLGERLAATGWLVPAPAVDARHQGQVVIENPGPGTVTATVAGAPPVPVGPGGRAAVPVPAGASTPVGPILVTAAGPVYVEYDIYGVGGTPTYCITSAVPLS